MLRVKPDFKEIVLSNNDLHEAGIQMLCQGLKASACQLESLKYVRGRRGKGVGPGTSTPLIMVCVSRLESCGITSANCKDLCDVVASKASLRQLDLGSNKLGNAGIAALCSGLLLPSCRLRTLW